MSNPRYQAAELSWCKTAAPFLISLHILYFSLFYKENIWGMKPLVHRFGSQAWYKQFSTRKQPFLYCSLILFTPDLLMALSFSS